MINLMPDWTFFVQLPIFLFAMIIMHLLIFRPVLRLIAKREALTQGCRQEAEQLNEKTEALVYDYEAQMKQARDQGLQLKAELTQEGEQQSREIMTQARSELDATIENNRQQISAESKEAQLALRKYSRELSGEMAEKLLGRKVPA